MVGQKFREVKTLGSGVSKLVVKATSDNTKKISDDTLRKLLDISGGAGGVSIDGLIKDLENILHSSSSWRRVLKCCQLFHRIIQKGYEDFSLGIVNIQESRGTIFNPRKVKCLEKTNSSHALLIRPYVLFLEKRIHLYQSTGIHSLDLKMKIEDKFFNNIDELINTISPLQNLLRALIDCHIQDHPSSKSVEIVMNTIVYILLDALVLYKLLNKCMIRLLDLFFKIEDLRLIEESVKVYKIHSRQMSEVIRMFTSLKSSQIIRSIIQIPKFEAPDDRELIDRLENRKKEIEKLNSIEITDISQVIGNGHVPPTKKLPGGSGGRRKGTSQSKKRVRKKKKKIVEEEKKSEQKEAVLLHFD